MNRFEELLKSLSAQPSVIVHLGAGDCTEHEFYNSIHPDHIFYVEPDQLLAEAAADAFSDAPHVRIIPCAIATTDGPQTLNVTNNRRFSSLLLPAELLDFYPNITVDNTTGVEAVTLNRFCRNQAVDRNADNLLVAEIQGMEKEVFPSTEVTTLQKFKWIIVRTSEEKLYAAATEGVQQSLSDTLQEAGFMVFSFAEEAPPYVNIVGIRNDSVIESSELKAINSDLLDTVKVLEFNLSKKDTALGTLKISSAAEQANSQVVLATRAAELEAAQVQIKSIADEIEKQQQNNQEITRILNDKTAELDASEALVKSTRAENEDLNRQLDTATKTIQAKSTDLDVSEALVKSIKADNKDLKRQLDTATSTIEAKSADLDENEALVKSIEAENKDLKRQLDTATSTIEEKSVELNAAQFRIQSLSDKNSHQEQQVSALTASLQAKAQEISGIQQTLRINNKLILKSDTDLRELQTQYRTALQHQEHQHILLSELKDKLRQASLYYQKLNLQSPLIDADLIAQDEPGEKDDSGER